MKLYFIRVLKYMSSVWLLTNESDGIKGVKDWNVDNICGLGLVNNGDDIVHITLAV